MNVSAFRGKFSVNCCKKLKKLLLAGQKMHLQRAMTSSPSVMACRHILSLCYCFLFSKWPEWITGGLGSLASQGMGCFSSRFIKFTSALAFVEMRTLCHKKYPLYPWTAPVCADSTKTPLCRKYLIQAEWRSVSGATPVFIWMRSWL